MPHTVQPDHDWAGEDKFQTRDEQASIDTIYLGGMACFSFLPPNVRAKHIYF